jgi:hypothetical protein
MAIEVSVTDQNVQVSTSGQTVNASVSGGVGPAGPTGATGAAGPAGTTTWAGITDKPATFSPTAHAASHASGGSDPIAIPAPIKSFTVTVGRADADYVCSGTLGSPTDHSTIQSAIAAVQASGGGTIYIRQGTYFLGGTVNITAANVAIVGSGRATELRAVGNYGNVFLCKITPTPTAWPGLSGLAFRSLRFETTVNRDSGAAIRAEYTHDAQFHDIYISDTTYGVSYGIGSASPYFYDGIVLVAEDQCDIANVTAQCRHYCVYIDGSGYASADFSYDGIVRDCDFYGVPSSALPWPGYAGTGIYIGSNCGGVVVDYCSINQMEYAVEAVMPSSYTQGGGIVTIRGGYTENNSEHGYRIVNYQNAVITDLWGALLLQGVGRAFVTSTVQGSIVCNASNATIYGDPSSVTGTGSWSVINGESLAAKASSSHSHGNITNDGKIGATSGLPIITGGGGLVVAGEWGATAGTACQGNDSRLSDSRTPTSHTHAASEIASGTLSDARLSVNARSSVESFIHPFLLGGL